MAENDRWGARMELEATFRGTRMPLREFRTRRDSPELHSVFLRLRSVAEPTPPLRCDRTLQWVVRWMAGAGGGEATFDAVAGQVICVPSDVINVEAFAQAVDQVGGAATEPYGIRYSAEVSIAPGWVAHRRPTLSFRHDLLAGAATPLIPVPDFAEAVQVHGNPQPTLLNGGVQLQTFDDGTAVGLVPTTITALFGPFREVHLSAADAFVAVTNQTLAAMRVTTVFYLAI